MTLVYQGDFRSINCVQKMTEAKTKSDPTFLFPLKVFSLLRS